MKHNSYPLRRGLAATIATVASLVTVSSCSGEQAAPTPVTRTEAPQPQPNQEIIKAQEKLDIAAKLVGRRVLEDILNPASHSEPYKGNYQGNKAQLLASNAPATAPEMYASYFPESRTLTISSVNIPEGDHFNSLAMSFDVRGNSQTQLSQQLANGQLTAGNFMPLLSSADTVLEQVSTIDDATVASQVTFANDLTHNKILYSLGQVIEGEEYDVPPLEADRRVDSFAASMSHIEDTLHDAVGY